MLVGFVANARYRFLCRRRRVALRAWAHDALLRLGTLLRLILRLLESLSLRLGALLRLILRLLESLSLRLGTLLRLILRLLESLSLRLGTLLRLILRLLEGLSRWLGALLRLILRLLEGLSRGLGAHRCGGRAWLRPIGFPCEVVDPRFRAAAYRHRLVVAHRAYGFVALEALIAGRHRTAGRQRALGWHALPNRRHLRQAALIRASIVLIRAGDHAEARSRHRCARILRRHAHGLFDIAPGQQAGCGSMRKARGRQFAPTWFGGNVSTHRR
jgi:hypothetical protein